MLNNEISLCNTCSCITRTVDGYCGKCEAIKDEPKPFICTKKRYKTEKEANEVINHITKTDWTELKTYKCHVCNNWHLTSKKIKL